MSCPPSIAVIRVTNPVPKIASIRVSTVGAGTLLEYTATAAAVLSSNCFISLDEDGGVIRADASLGIPAMGFVKSAAIIGAQVRVITGGFANGFSGRTPPASQYLAAAGQVTETVPTTGLIQKVGSALTDSKISINIEEAITVA